jgi:hypothetical protein
MGTDQEPRDSCCFCDRPIAVQGDDPCSLILTKAYWREMPDEDLAMEGFFCHLECLKQRLHRDYVGYLVQQPEDV